MYLNQNVKPYTDDVLLNSLFIEKLNYFLVQFLSKFIIIYIRSIKFKIKMIFNYVNNIFLIKKKYYSRLLFMNELSTIKIFFNQDKIKLNLNFSNSELLKNIKIKIINIDNKKKNLFIIKRKKIYLLQCLLQLYLNINIFKLGFKIFKNNYFFFFKYVVKLLIKYLLKLKKKLFLF